MQTPQPLKALNIALYVLAAIALVGAIFILITFLGAASGLSGTLSILHVLGLGQFINLISGPLNAAIINLGIIFTALTLLVSLLLYAAGLLVSRVRDLNARLVRLENLLAAQAAPELPVEGKP
jgi:hypothetical protein